MKLKIWHHCVAFLGCVAGLFGVFLVQAVKMYLGDEPNFDFVTEGIGIVIGIYLYGLLSIVYKVRKNRKIHGAAHTGLERYEIGFYILNSYAAFIVAIGIVLYWLIIHA